MKHLIIPLIVLIPFIAGAQSPDSLKKKRPKAKGEVSISLGYMYEAYKVKTSFAYDKTISNPFLVEFSNPMYHGRLQYLFNVDNSVYAGPFAEFSYNASAADSWSYSIGMQLNKPIYLKKERTSYLYPGVTLCYFTPRPYSIATHSGLGFGIQVGSTIRLSKNIYFNIEPGVRFITGNVKGFTVPVTAGIRIKA
jgi:hypothetical protein